MFRKLIFKQVFKFGFPKISQLNERLLKVYCNPIYTRELWECNECSQIDTQSHILMTCPGYQHLRVNKNFDNDHDLVKFFQQVIDLRESVDK